jgi:branched-chain amino acid aminotransferase
LGQILSSITRLSILEAAPKIGITVREESIGADDIFAADEIFSAHTGIKVCPIDRLEDKKFKAPGPVTAKLMQLMDNIIHFKDDRFSNWFQPLS